MKKPETYTRLLFKELLKRDLIENQTDLATKLLSSKGYLSKVISLKEEVSKALALKFNAAFGVSVQWHERGDSSYLP